MNKKETRDNEQLDLSFKKETRDNEHLEFIDDDIPEGWKASNYVVDQGKYRWKYWVSAIFIFSLFGFIIYYFILDIVIIAIYMLIAFLDSILYEFGFKDY